MSVVPIPAVKKTHDFAFQCDGVPGRKPLEKFQRFSGHPGRQQFTVTHFHFDGGRVQPRGFLGHDLPNVLQRSRRHILQPGQIQLGIFLALKQIGPAEFQDQALLLILRLQGGVVLEDVYKRQAGW